MKNLYHRLARFFYPQGSVRKVWRGPARGALFEVVTGMGATYAMGFPHWNFAFLSRHIRPGMVIYDVGANCGQMALFFSRVTGPSGRVIAFEPVPSNLLVLRNNLQLNRSQNVEVFEAAVCADHEPKRFCLNTATHTMGTLESATHGPAWWDSVLVVPALTLDSLIGTQAPPDLLKIDVEGGGGGVIQGALRLIEYSRPCIYFELHADGPQAQELEALRLLRDSFGYTMTCIEFPEADPFQPAWGPAIWCSPPQSGGSKADSFKQS